MTGPEDRPAAGGPGAGPAGWTVLSAGGPARAADGAAPAGGAGAPVSGRRVALQVVAAVVGVLLVVGLAGVAVVRRIAEQEAVNDAAQLTDLLARTVIMPAVDDALARGEPAAVARFDRVVRDQVPGDRFVRVKIWSADGTVRYSDAAALVGRRFGLEDDARAVLSTPVTVAEVSDLSRPENEFERGQGRLLEVYRPVWTPSGQPLLFETYARYDTVTARTGDLWRGFGGIVVSSLLLLVVLLLPLLWALLDRQRRAAQQRERLLRHAVDASEQERRRIAADLHDGVVQELVAASLVIEASGPAAPREAAAAVRGAVGALRTLLVDIYPPTLDTAGLGPALADLAAPLRGRGLEVSLTVDGAASAALDAPGSDGSARRLVYRVARETLGNAVKHAGAGHVEVSLAWAPDGPDGSDGPDGAPGDRRVRLEVRDDGAGFDPADGAVRSRPGHLGLRLLADLAAAHGAALAVSTAPGAGCRWRLDVHPDGTVPPGSRP